MSPWPIGQLVTLGTHPLSGGRALAWCPVLAHQPTHARVLGLGLAPLLQDVSGEVTNGDLVQRGVQAELTEEVVGQPRRHHREPLDLRRTAGAGRTFSFRGHGVELSHLIS